MATKKSEAATRSELQATERRLMTAIEDYGRGFTAVVERIELQNRAVIEALQASTARLERRIDEVRAELLARIEVLEFVVRKSSEDIRKNSEDIRKNSEDIRKNSEDILLLRQEIADLRLDVRAKVDRAELGQVEARVAVLEERVGISSAGA